MRESHSIVPLVEILLFSTPSNKTTTQTNSCANFEPETPWSLWFRDLLEMMTLDLINDLRIFLGGFSLSLSILKECAMAAVVGNQENHFDTGLLY